MRLSKLSIRKLKKYVDFLHEFDCDIMIYHGKYDHNYVSFLADIDSVNHNQIDHIEVYNYIKCETVQTYYSVNAFLIYFSILRSNPRISDILKPVFDSLGEKTISVQSLN